MNKDRHRLLARREAIRRHLAELSKGTTSQGVSPARRRTSSQMLRYLLDDIERELGEEATGKHRRS